jgi:hypothetical protein
VGLSYISGHCCIKIDANSLLEADCANGYSASSQTQWLQACAKLIGLFGHFSGRFHSPFGVIPENRTVSLYRNADQGTQATQRFLGTK